MGCRSLTTNQVNIFIWDDVCAISLDSLNQKFDIVLLVIKELSMHGYVD